MIITIDTEILKEFNITPNEYVILFEYYQTGYCIFDDKQLIENLIKKGFINENFKILEKTLKLLLVDDEEWNKYFEIFWNTYPSRVYNRILRTESSSTLQGKKCKSKFKKACYDKLSNCERVIKALNNQINTLKNTKEFDYFQNIETWLNQNTWEKWETVLEKRNERVEGIN